MILRKFFGAGLSAFALSASAQLPPVAEEMLRTNNIPLTSVGVVAFRLSDGKPIFSHQPQKVLQPASTMKVVTAIVGLERLGPTYRGRVELRHTGELRNGVIEGDLILKGMGSPDFKWEDFQKLLREARVKGLREVRGNFIVDRSFFSPTRFDVGLPPFDEAPEFQYNVIPDALLMNTNLSQIEIVSAGNEITARMVPWPDRVKFNLSFRLVDRPCAQWEQGWKIPETTKSLDGELTVKLHGEFPNNCTATPNVSVMDRADYTDLLFRTLWKEEGGLFAGRVIEGVAPAFASSKLLSSHLSRSLADFARDVNKRSDNPMTRMLFLTLGSSAVKREGAVANEPTLVAAEREVRKWFKEKSIDDTGLVLDNGSGLSRSEKISAAQLGGVLKAAYASDWAPEFLSTLPIIGVDGAMRTRLADTPAKQKGRIKTGTLRNVVSVAGYMPDATGQLCVVVAIINDDKMRASAARPIVDAILNAVTQTGK